MTEYLGLPLADIRRIGRAVSAFEAQSDGPTSPRAFGQSALTQQMLLTPFAPAIDSADAADGAPPLGRYFTAKAALLQPTELRCQVLRQIADWPLALNLRFRLGFRGAVTSFLSLNITADELQAELAALGDLDGHVGVIGHQTEFGQPGAQVVNLARQWHIVFDDDVDGGELLRFVGEDGTFFPPPAVPPVPLRLFQDWWLPDVGQVNTVWAGLPSDGLLQPGACGWTLPFGSYGPTWLHGECHTWES